MFELNMLNVMDTIEYLPNIHFDSKDNATDQIHKCSINDTNARENMCFFLFKISFILSIRYY